MPPDAGQLGAHSSRRPRRAPTHAPSSRGGLQRLPRTLPLLLPLLAVACVPRDQAGFEAIGPAHRLDAIVLAADQSDDASLRGLIQQLDSDDPAARLLAIRALEKRTGQTHDYRYDAPPWERDAAVDRWMLWYHARDTAAPPGASPTRTQEGP